MSCQCQAVPHLAKPFADLNLDLCYRSENAGNIVDGFYTPCLERACCYRRAVGYFSSAGLSAAAKGLSAFIRGSGTMLLVASPCLSEEDVLTISRGYDARHDVVARALLAGFKPDIDSITQDRLSCLAWLIAHKRLEIKLAVKKSANGRGICPGIYHEKFGILGDCTGEKVAFSGSSNESAGGLVDNFESIDVFCSWADAERVRIKEAAFERLWTDQTPNLEVTPFPLVALEKLLSYAKQWPPEVDPESARDISRPPTLPLPRDRTNVAELVVARDYQNDAIAAWVKNGHRGFFEMATGTGKTITALHAAERLLKELHQLGIVILVPYQHLVDQWEETARKFGFNPVKCYESTSAWREVLEDQIVDYGIGVRPAICAIVTHKTASEPTFETLIRRIRKPLLVIGDEAHHLGSLGYSPALNTNAQFRLGLSATPTRWFDEEGTSRLTEYFGKTVFEFPLIRAIEEGFLCRYLYFPHISPLTDEEFQKYEELSVQIARVWRSAQSDRRASDRLEFLLRERAEVLNCGSTKLDLLRGLLRAENPDQLCHTLFYCAPKQIDEVVSILASEFGLRIRRFTAEERPAERQELLGDFDAGRIQALVAMKCLDEGVDVPATKMAFILASSSNPREFVQRRGRILRTHPGKRRALVHDLVSVPPLSATTDWVSDCERNLLRRELARFKEFATAADNEYQATAEILEIAKHFHILDF